MRLAQCIENKAFIVVFKALLQTEFGPKKDVPDNSTCVVARIYELLWKRRERRIQGVAHRSLLLGVRAVLIW